jgi:hypothetical protein
LHAQGIRAVGDLVGRDPEELYARSCMHQGVTIDRCLLYVYRCAVYYAEARSPDPELLKWWAWKDAARPPLHRLRHVRSGG